MKRWLFVWSYGVYSEPSAKVFDETNIREILTESEGFEEDSIDEILALELFSNYIEGHPSGMAGLIVIRIDDSCLTGQSIIPGEISAIPPAPKFL